MDYQILFNIVLGLAGFLGGWTLNNMTKAIERLDSDVRDLPKTYVTKEDWREDMKSLKEDMGKGFDKIDSTLGTIFKKLDSKEDKS
ncbi:hypothetical protein UFOVP317_15 [uncultured Caudovirales phage]|uniref:Uncharacterized protein n=1 Tax=uncultured Caudovirales phage TaxID=2100421 RepID=A0A6J5LSP9_9CAUD|nr:hypothetical protein UFOVP317_15 [uncultured Caudovirales phage]